MELEAAAQLGCIVKENLSNPDGRVVTSCTVSEPSPLEGVDLLAPASRTLQPHASAPLIDALCGLQRHGSDELLSLPRLSVHSGLQGDGSSSGGAAGRHHTLLPSTPPEVAGAASDMPPAKKRRCRAKQPAKPAAAGGAAAVLAFATPATPLATQTVQGGATEQLHPLALGAPHVYGASGDLLHRALSLLDSDFGCGNLLAAPLLL